MKKGFTQTELLLVVGIMMLLLTLGAVIFSNFARQDQLLIESRQVENLISEARIKTVAGYTAEGAQALNYGVYFEVDRYFLFTDLVFDPLDPHNQEFILPVTLEFETILLPSESIVFEKITGEVRNYNPSQNYVVLKDTQITQAKKISFNELGVILIENQ